MATAAVGAAVAKRTFSKAIGTRTATRSTGTLARSWTRERGTQTNVLTESQLPQPKKSSGALKGGLDLGGRTMQAAGFASMGVASSAVQAKSQQKMQKQQHQFTEKMYDKVKGDRESSLAEVGLPRYMAHGVGRGGSFEPHVTQQSRGQVTYTSQIPGDPTRQAFTGTSSQVGAGWGSIM